MVYPETYALIITAYGVMVGHFYWAGIRPGRIHRPTIWRGEHQLRLWGFTQAADRLRDHLDTIGEPYEDSDRHGRPAGL